MASIKERAAVSAIIKTLDNPVIVDLGAHKGEDTRWMLNAWKGWGTIRAVMVEADPRNVAQIDVYGMLEGPANPGRSAFVSLMPAAIAAESGKVRFYQCDNGSGTEFASGSIRKPTGHLKYFPWCTFNEGIEIDAFTLDHVCTIAHLDHISILWCDIQGAERDMIAGGRKALAATSYIFIESEEVEFYEGQALRDELLSLLPDFYVMETFEYNLLLARNF